MISVDLQVRAGGAKSYLNKIKRSIKWAHIKSINYVAEAVQHHMVTDHFPKTFTMRGPWYLPKNRYGIRVYKGYRGRNFAVVGTSAPWMALHDTGGIKTPRQTKKQAEKGINNRNFAIAEEARASEASKIARPKYISSLSRRSKKGQKVVKWVPYKQKLLYINYSKRDSEGRGVVEYSAVRQARIKPVLRFEQVAQMVVARTYRSIWAENFVKEIQDAKRSKT